MPVGGKVRIRCVDLGSTHRAVKPKKCAAFRKRHGGDDCSPRCTGTASGTWRAWAGTRGTPTGGAVPAARRLGGAVVDLRHDRVGAVPSRPTRRGPRCDRRRCSGPSRGRRATPCRVRTRRVARRAGPRVPTRWGRRPRRRGRPRSRRRRALRLVPSRARVPDAGQRAVLLLLGIGLRRIRLRRRRGTWHWQNSGDRAGYVATRLWQQHQPAGPPRPSADTRRRRCSRLCR